MVGLYDAQLMRVDILVSRVRSHLLKEKLEAISSFEVGFVSLPSGLGYLQPSPIGFLTQYSLWLPLPIISCPEHSWTTLYQFSMRV